MESFTMIAKLEKILDANKNAEAHTNLEGFLLFKGALHHVQSSIPLLQMIDAKTPEHGLGELVAEFERVANKEYF